MITAIALFGDEVSPRFGCAREFLLVTHEGGRGTERAKVEVGGVAPVRLPALLASHGVDEVICGGIHHRFLQDLRALDIVVTWGVIGPAEDALEARLANQLETNQIMTAGRCRRRRERRRRGSGPRIPDCMPSDLMSSEDLTSDDLPPDRRIPDDPKIPERRSP